MKQINRFLSILLAAVIAMTLGACAPANESRSAVSDSPAVKTAPVTTEPTAASPSPSPAVTPTPSPDPAPEAEPLFFAAKEYTVYYEAVPQNRQEEEVGTLADYIDTEEVDMERNRIFYIRYTGAEKDGETIRMGSVWSNIPWYKIVFSVGGTDYQQSSLLINSGTDLYITYLFVPIDTPDDVPVSINYVD